jgi:hypothetical protein
MWIKSSPFDASLEVGTGETTVISMHPDFHELHENSTAKLQDAFLANSVRVYGTLYKPG